VTAVQIMVYTPSFDPANPCNNAIFVSQSGNNILDQTGPNYDYFVDNAVVVMMNAGTNYVIVVSSTSQSTLDGFAMQISPADGKGSTDTENFWLAAYASSSGSCTTNPFTVSFDLFTWAPTMTGYWDFIVSQYANSTSAFSMSGIYFSIFNSSSILASDLNTTSCPSSFIQGGYALSSGDTGMYYNLLLTSGVKYTVVISGYASTDVGNYAYWVRPTARYSYANTPLFAQPNTQSPISPCYTGTQSGPWLSTVVSTQGNRLLTKFKCATSSTIFVYSGLNAGTTSSAPTTCPTTTSLLNIGFNSDYSVSTNTSAGQYTIILSPYSVATSYDYAILFVMTGQTVIGPAVTSTTTSRRRRSGSGSRSNSRSGASSSGASASGATSSGASSSAASSSAKTTATATSGIEALIVSTILLVVVLLF